MSGLASQAARHADVMDAGQVRFVWREARADLALVPDEVAQGLRREVLDGWQEFPGVGYGTSRLFLPGSWVHDTTAVIIQAFGVSPVPAGLPEGERRRADGARRAARSWGHCSGTLVIAGESVWDDAGSGFRYPVGSADCQRLRVPHYPIVDEDDDTGRVGIRYLG